MDEKDFLLRNIEENWTHAKKSEDKRAHTANLIISLTVIIQVTLTLIGFNARGIPLTLLLVFIGCYGIFTTMKLYERSQFHILRARELRDHLDKLLSDSQISNLQHIAETKHQQYYPIFYKIRLNNIWLFTYIFVIIIGLIETIICFWLS